MRRIVLAMVVSMLAGCPQARPPTAKRAVVRSITGDQIELLPTEGQLPYCLVFTSSASKVVRQLTMTLENKSVACKAGRPIGGTSYRIPIQEGKVQVHILFSDQKLNATSVAQQISERLENPSFAPVDLRLPGKVILEKVDFTPGSSWTDGGT